MTSRKKIPNSAMDRITMKQHIEGMIPEAVFPENKQYLEVIVPSEKLHPFCENLKVSSDLLFDYLICLTAVDWPDHFMMVYHLTSTRLQHTLVIKSRIENKEKPVIDTLSDIWKTAEFHEREVFDLFGISFRNHPDLRRLFLEDDYGYPLRKDFADETRMIVK
jgi:NADH-quinone oxidoreductase subunit C